MGSDADNNIDTVVVLVIHVDYELRELKAFHSMNVARAVALKKANEYYSRDRTFENLEDAFDYEKSEEWWDNDDRCTIELSEVSVENFTGRETIERTTVERDDSPREIPF